MKCLSNLLIVIVFNATVCHTSSVFADDYWIKEVLGHRPIGSALRLGVPFDPGNPTNNSGEKWFEFETIQQEGLTFSLKMSVVENFESFDASRKNGIGLKARYGLFSGDADVAVLNSVRKSDYEVTFLVEADLLYGPEICEDLKLTAESERTLEQYDAAGSLDRFFKLAGPEIVVAIQRGSTLSVVCSVQCSSMEKRNEMALNLKAEYQGNGGSLSIQQAATKIDNTSRVSLDVTHFGGQDSTTELLGLIASKTRREVETAIKESLSKVSRDSCPILSFSTQQSAKFSKFNIHPESDRMIDVSSSAKLSNSLLFRLELLKRKLSAKLGLVRLALGEAKSADWPGATGVKERDFVQGGRDAIVDSRDHLQSANDSINELRKRISADKAFSDVETHEKEVREYESGFSENLDIAKFVESEFVFPIKWLESGTNGSYIHHGENVYTHVFRFRPVVSVEYPYLIQSAEIYCQRIDDDADIGADMPLLGLQASLDIVGLSKMAKLTKLSLLPDAVSDANMWIRERQYGRMWCDPAGNFPSRQNSLLNAAKTAESKLRYVIVVTDIDGNVRSTVDLGNVKDPILAAAPK